MNLTKIVKIILKYVILVGILLFLSWYLIRGLVLLLGENFKQL